MRTFVIGTAGHVNHGKTTLVHALTGVSTDRLPEEKRRGMTIELGFAPLVLEGGDVRASLVDVPGHRRFVPTMIAGASGIELVLLVVAADEGVMPQTREHITVCELLGLRRAVVALTKIDRADDDMRALAIEDARSAIVGRMDAEIVPCASSTGEGVEGVRDAVARALRNAAPPGPTARLWIDRVLHVRGTGTVVTGTLVGGAIARGERLVLATRRDARPVVVRGLQVHGAPVDKAWAATRLALNLSVDAEDVARGDLLIAEGDAPTPTSCIDVSLRGERFARGAQVTLHVGTASRSARVTRVDPLGAADERNGPAWLARLALDVPLPVAPGERYLVRAPGTSAALGARLGGGLVLDARPIPRMKAAARRTLAEAIVAGDARTALETLVDAVAPRALVPDQLALAVSVVDEARRASSERGGLVACGSGVLRRATLASLADRARQLVADHAARAPLDRGMPLAALRAELARAAGDEVADSAIRAARAQRSPDDVGAIAVLGDVVVSAVRAGRLPADVAEHMNRARAVAVEAGVHGLSNGRLAELLGIPPARARAVLAALERDAALVRAGDLWFSRDVVDEVRARVTTHLASGRRMTVIDAKAVCDLPRRQAILLLEHFDQLGLTRRVGDARVLVASKPP